MSSIRLVADWLAGDVRVVFRNGLDLNQQRPTNQSGQGHGKADPAQLRARCLCPKAYCDGEQGRAYPQVRLWSDIDNELTLRLPPVLLDQVLANLMLNATQAGAQDIWLCGWRDEATLVLELQDHAGGMSDNALSQAFTPFTTSKATGMGLGLAICQPLMRQCDSEITLENRLSPKTTLGICVALRFMVFDGENKCQ